MKSLITYAWTMSLGGQRHFTNLKHMLNEVRNYVRLGIKQCPKFQVYLQAPPYMGYQYSLWMLC
jgi:hypothetical protein